VRIEDKVASRLLDLAEALLKDAEESYYVKDDGQVAIVSDTGEITVKDKNTGQQKEKRIYPSKTDAMNALKSEGWK